MSERKSRWRRVAVRVGAVLLIGCVAAHLYRDYRAVHVYIRNAGKETLRDLTIYIRDDAYSAGDVGPGQRVHIRTFPEMEGMLSVGFLDESGRSKRFVLDSYVSGWCAGWIDATIDSQRVREKHSEFRTNLLP